MFAYLGSFNCDSTFLIIKTNEYLIVNLSTKTERFPSKDNN